MACKIILEDKNENPILDEDGNKIVAPLFNDLVAHFKKEKFTEDEALTRAEEIFKFIGSPLYIGEYGDFLRKNYTQKFPRDEDGNLKVDKYGFPLAEDVLYQYHTHPTRFARWNIGKTVPVANMAQRKLQDFIHSIEKQLRILNQKKGNLLEKGRLKELSRQYYEAIQAAKESQAYIKLAQEALKTLNKLKEDITKDDLSKKDLVNIFKIVSQYKQIADIRDLIRQTKSATNKEAFPEHVFLDISDKELEELLEGLDEVSRIISDLEAAYKEKALAIIADKAFGFGAAFTENIRNFYRESYRIQHKRGSIFTKKGIINFAKGEDEEYNKEMEAYVEARMEESKELNERERKRFVLQSIFIGQDIDFFQKYFLSIADIKDSGARAVGKLMLASEEASRLKFEAWKDRVQPYFEAYEKEMKKNGVTINKSGLLKFYNLIAERQYNENGSLSDDIGTGYYVHRYHSNWTEDLKKIREKKRELKEEAEEKGWIDKYFGTINSKIIEEERAKGNKRPQILKSQMDFLDSLFEYNTSFNEEREDIRNWYEEIEKINKEKKLYNKAIGKLVESLGLNPTDSEVIQITEAINKLKLEKEVLQSEIARYRSLIQREIFDLDSVSVIPAKNEDTGNLIISERLEEIKKELGLELNPIENYVSAQYNELQRLLNNDIGNPIVAYYRKVVKESLKEADKRIPDSKTMYFRMLGIRKQKMERMQNFSRENALGDANRFRKIYEYTKQVMSETFKYKEGKDIESSQQRGDLEKGEDYNLAFDQEIPIFFRSKLDPKDQSYNVHANLLIGVNVAYKYEEMSEIEPVLEMYMALLKDKKMLQGFQKFIKPFKKDFEFKTTVKSEGERNYLYDALKDHIAARMYGEVIEETGLKIGNIPVRKLWSMWLKYVGMTLLGLNPYSMVQNMLLGNVLTFIESIYGEYISMKSFKEAQTFYLSRGVIGANLSKKGFENSLFGDMNRKFPKNIVARLGIKFDAKNDFSVEGGTDVYAYSNAITNLIDTDTFLVGQFMGEHQMHHVTLLGILAEIKVLNEEGEYLSKTGAGISKNRAGARNLLKSYSVEGSELKLFKDVAFIEMRVGESYKKLPLYAFLGTSPKEAKAKQELNRKTEIEISILAKDINRKLHGAYAAENAAAAQRHAWGQSLLSMRRFLPPAAQRRIGGAGAFSYGVLQFFFGKGLREVYRDKRKNNKVRSAAARDSFFRDMNDPSGINTSTKEYNPNTGAIEEAMYITMLKFFGYSGYSMLKTLKDMFYGVKDHTDAKVAFIGGHTMREWEALSMHERANIVRSVIEIGFGYLLFFVAGPLLKELAEEDDDDAFLYHMTFFTTRLAQELTMYSNFFTLGEILQNPATTTSMLQRIGKAFGQLGEDIIYNNALFGGELERYQRGLRKGETKLGRRALDVLPLAKQIGRYQYIEDTISNMYRED